MGVEGGTRFIPEAALGWQGTSCFLLNAFQLGWLQAWGGQVIYSNTQWNRPAGTWTRGFAACPCQSAFCFLLSPLLWAVPSSQRAVSGAAHPPSCPHSGLEEEACYRSSLNVLALQRQANCSMPAQSIQCLARVRLKIATPTRQDWKRKNLAHPFPLRGDFSSLSFFSFFFLSFFFKRGNPLFTSWNPKYTSGQFAILWPMNICGPGCSLGIGSAWAELQSCLSQKGILGWVQQSGSEEACEWSGPRCPLVLVFQGHACTQLQLV